MTDDITLRPEQTNRAGAMMQHEERPMQPVSEAGEQAMKQLAAHGVACPVCGVVNDEDALYCASCGAPLRKASCPHCGNEIDPDADFCESCHHYINPNVCSFCGAALTGREAFCPECGNPRGGIVCPTCHTLNDFAFCKQCGQPLTDEARAIVAELRSKPEYMELARMASEYSDLSTLLPYQSERDIVHEEENARIRRRVLTLLAQDKGIANPDIADKKSARMSKSELDARKKDLLDKLSEILDKMEVPPMASPAKVRNFAMAQKPVGVRLAWVCNYKHAMHSSPCGCAKPQMGGKWVILGKGSKQEVKDDL